MLKFLIPVSLIITDLIFFRVYSMLGRYKHKKRQKQAIYPKPKLQSKQTIRKRIITKIMGFLFGLYFVNIYLIGIIPSFNIRKILYKHIFLMKIGKNSKIREFLEVLAPWNVTIGDNTIIGKNCILDARNGIKIGNNVNISDSCAIWTEQHDIDDLDFNCNNSGGNVTIGDRTWLCYRSIVLPKVKMGDGVVLATGGIATKDCEEYALYGGIPAKKIRPRNKEIDYELNLDWAHIY